MLKVFLLDICMLQKMSEKPFASIDSLYLALATTFLSMGFAVFTLSVAFIDSKKHELRNIYDECENNGISLSLSRKIASLRHFIKIMTIIANLSLWNIICSLAIMVLLIIYNFTDYIVFFYLMLCLTFMSIWFTIQSLWKLFKWYRNKTLD
mgnify:FL=1